METIRGWHFVGKTLRDGSPIPKDGKKLGYLGRLVICKSGLHASKLPSDALQYALGNTLCYVECSGKFIHQHDKFVCSERTIIARMDATELCQYFARQVALSVIHLYPNGTDDVVFDFLMTGENANDANAAANAANDANAANAAAYAANAVAYAAYAAAYAANAANAANAAYAAEFNQLVNECFEDFL